MKKVFVFLVMLFFLFLYTNDLKAQEIQEVTSDLTLEQSEAGAEENSKKAITKKREPIPRAYLVEDYLPILGKQARARGISAPKPFFITAIYYHMEIPQNITNAVGYGFTQANGEPADFGIDEMSVRMENAKVITNSGGLRAGFNLLPFMSLFGVYIHTEGYSEFTAVVDGIWGIMTNGYQLDQKIDFSADTGAIGVAFAYGYRLGPIIPFGMINGNYAWTTTNMTDQTIATVIGGAKIGITVPLPKNMRVGANIGAQYQWLPMGNQRSGSYTVTLPAGTIDGSTEPYTITSKYRANAENASPWAMTAGLIFSPSKFFDIVLDFGFLSRFTTMVAVQTNF